MRSVPAAYECVVVTWPSNSVLPVAASRSEVEHGMAAQRLSAAVRHDTFVVVVDRVPHSRHSTTSSPAARPQQLLRGAIQIRSVARNVVVLACNTSNSDRVVHAALAEESGEWELECGDEQGWVVAAFGDGQRVTDWSWCVPGVDCVLRQGEPTRPFRWQRTPINTPEDLARQPLSQFGGLSFPSLDVIGIGETTHGTAEFGAVRLALAQAAASAGWLRWIAIEANEFDVAELNEFTSGASRDAHKILLDMGWWIHRTREFLDLLLWLRAWNRDHSVLESIALVGIDAQSLDSALRWVIRRPQISLAWRKRASAFFRAHRDELRASSAIPIANSVVDQVIELTDAVVTELGSCPLSERISRHIRDCLDLRCSPSLSEQSVVRDAIMARRVMQVQRDVSARGGLVFAHLAHLQRQDAFGDNATLGGELLRLGVSYSVIGLHALEGQFLAAVPNSSSGFDLQKCSLDSLPSPAIELSALGSTTSFGAWMFPKYALDDTDEVSVPPVCTDPLHYCHSIGAVAEATAPSGSTSITHALRSSDAVICLRSSSPVSLLPSHIVASYEIPTSSLLESPSIDNASIGELPKPWTRPPHRCGNGFECSVQRSLRDTRRVILVRGVSAEPDDAAVICVRARGATDVRRVLFSLQVRSNDQFSVNIWIRLDTIDRALLSVAQNRVSPSSDWTLASCAIDIPTHEVVISVGTSISGSGECEMQDFHIVTYPDFQH